MRTDTSGWGRSESAKFRRRVKDLVSAERRAVRKKAAAAVSRTLYKQFADLPENRSRCVRRVHEHVRANQLIGTMRHAVTKKTNGVSKTPSGRWKSWATIWI